MLPSRNPQYRKGRSKPRTLRVNDELWRDFCARAERAGYSPTEVLRHLMEGFVEGSVRELAKKGDTSADTSISGRNAEE